MNAPARCAARGSGHEQQQLADFKQRYERERAKLTAALEKGAVLGSKLQVPGPRPFPLL